VCTRRWFESANNAIEGVLHAAKSQRHVRYHFYSAVVVILLSTVLGLSRYEFIAVSIMVILVLATELLNTAIEAAIDLFSLDFHPKARIAKDVAAGAVLVTAVGAATVGYMILYPAIRRVLDTGLELQHHGKPEITLVSLLVVLILVVIVKAWLGHGHPLRGGMPSGHAAVAFSAWVAIIQMTDSSVVSVLAGLLAAGIAGSRITLKVHTLFEVLLGALLGMGVTYLLFFVFT